MSDRGRPFVEFDDILIEQGLADNFYTQGQLKPESLQEAATKSGQKITLNMREGYDHSYYFIAAFIDVHVRFHGERLKRKQRELAERATAKYDFSTTAGKVIECKAMVARAAKQPLSVERIRVSPPGPDEVRAVCHTDLYTLDGHDPKGYFLLLWDMKQGVSWRL